MLFNEVPIQRLVVQESKVDVLAKR